MKLYSHPKCSTCKNAIDFLKSKSTKYELVDITVNPPSKRELKEMLSHYGSDLRKLFNTSGIQYRELKIKDKLPKMSEDQALTLLSKNGMLVKRPFLIASKTGLVGFKKEEWKKLTA